MQFRTEHITGLDVSAAALAENSRVHAHILAAEQRARRRSIRQLNPLQRLTRALLLDELSLYRRARRFPVNSEFRRHRAPYFIDHRGTRCAMAHLLEVGGQAELVRQVASTQNNAFVSELANIPAFVAWLTAAGLTLEEAARIQPTYCSETEASECYCFGQESVVGATVISSTQSSGEHGSSGATNRSTWTIRAQVVHVAGEAKTVSPGDEIELRLSGPRREGEWLLLSSSEYAHDGGTTNVFRELLGLNVNGANVTCTAYDGERAHPVPIDVAVRAMGAPMDECISTLRRHDPRLTARDSDCGSCGCRIGEDSGAFGVPLISTAAILLAILGYRRARRRSEWTR